MRDTTIARSYAETFLALAGKAEDLRAVENRTAGTGKHRARVIEPRAIGLTAADRA